jgi:ribonuclease BN (tRNA processing enzyme)
MKLEVLGCSGNVTRHHQITAYLVNDKVLFDAGTVTEVLAPASLERISHVFLSHIHLDHVKGLCSLAEESSMREARSITVLADEHVIDAISRHVFNNSAEEGGGLMIRDTTHR